MTAHIFLNTTPNELILFLTFFKFPLVYFKIYFKDFQTTFQYCFELYVDLSIFQIGIGGKVKNFQKVLMCPSPLCTLKKSILNLGIVLVVCCLLGQMNAIFMLKQSDVISCADITMRMNK